MKKKLLIGVTKSNFGGAQKYVFDLAKNMRDDFDVTVFFGGQGQLLKQLEEEKIRSLSIPTIQRDINLFKDIFSFFFLFKVFLQEKPDIIHLNSSKMVGLGALAGRMARVPNIILTIHGFPFQEDRGVVWKFFAQFFSWISILLSHQTIVVSQNDLTLGQKFPFVKKKIILIYNGIPLSPKLLLKEEARKELLPDLHEKYNDAFWLGTIAELHPNKNLASTIQAIASYNTMPTSWKKILFIIIGQGGEERGKLEAIIKKLNLSEAVFLVGPKNEAQRFLLAFNGFILASKKEGFPTVLLEAGLASLPVIATSIGGIPELIENEKTGILIEGTTQEAIGDALKKTLGKSELDLITLGGRLKEKVEQKFSLDSMVTNTKNIYNRLK